ncbi:MAG: hypothetical protein GX573_20830 [Chloroflexi bacterium]|nr:hypothetical protein [Chloroflexota bacterium]
MAKKSTTGGPRPRRRTDEDIQRRAQYRSRAERERLWQRRALIVAGIIAGLSIVLLLGSLVYEQLIVPGQPITTVNGQEISTNDFQDRVRFIRWQTASQVRELYFLVGGDLNTIQQYAGQQINQLRSPSLLGGQVLQEMEEEVLLREEAEARGIVIDEAAINEQVDQYIAQTVGLEAPQRQTATPTTVPSTTPTPLVSPTPTNTPAPTATATPLPTETPAEGAAAATAEAGDEAAATAEVEVTAEAEADATVEPVEATEEPAAATEEPAGTAEPVEGTAEAEATAEADATEQPTIEPSPTLSSADIRATLDSAADDYFDTASGESDVDRDVVRDVFYADALRNAIYESMAAEVPLEELQVDARHILIAFNPENPSAATSPTEEQKAAALAEAEAVAAALQNGEPFADLARAVSDDTTSAQQGGDLGWASPDNYTANFADTVREAEIGVISGPIETEFGYHIIQVNGREVRPLTESELSQRKQQKFQDWLTARQAEADINRRDDWIDRVPDQPSYNELLGDILPLG